ncbi:MAG: outer membrane beta-barrel protein [Ferruginibacter sp.]
MKKVILSVAVFAIASLSATAQKEAASDKQLKFSVGVEAGLPIGDAKEGYSFGIGGSAQAEYAAAENVALTLNAGYITLLGKTIEEEKVPSLKLIPVLAGAKFFFNEKVYGHAQLGMTFASVKVAGISASTSAFTYAPGIGVQAAENFDVELKYQAYSKGGTTSFIGLRAAYTF